MITFTDPTIDHRPMGQRTMPPGFFRAGCEFAHNFPPSKTPGVFDSGMSTCFHGLHSWAIWSWNNRPLGYWTSDNRNYWMAGGFQWGGSRILPALGPALGFGGFDKLSGLVTHQGVVGYASTPTCMSAGDRIHATKPNWRLVEA